MLPFLLRKWSEYSRALLVILGSYQYSLVAVFRTAYFVETLLVLSQTVQMWTAGKAPGNSWYNVINSKLSLRMVLPTKHTYLIWTWLYSSVEMVYKTIKHIDIVSSQELCVLLFFSHSLIYIVKMSIIIFFEFTM